MAEDITGFDPEEIEARNLERAERIRRQAIENNKKLQNLNEFKNSPTVSSNPKVNDNIDFKDKDNSKVTAENGFKITEDPEKPWTSIDAFKRSFTGNETATADTINNIGSEMSKRMSGGVKKALTRMEFSSAGDIDSDTYTPISFPTMKLANQLGVEPAYKNGSGTLTGEFAEMMNEEGNLNLRSNQIGDSWVVNPPFQFNPNDDVRSNLSFPEFGRVFNEKINANYPIVVFEVGRIEYNMGHILSNTILDSNDNDSGLASRIRGGKGGIGNLVTFPVAVVGSVLKTSWHVVTYPISKLTGLKKFAKFRVDTALFAKYFNDMAQTLAGILGLLEPIDSQDPVLANLEAKEGDSNSAFLDSIENISSIFTNKTPDKDSAKGNQFDPSGEVSGGSYAGIRRRLFLETVIPGALGTAEADYIPFLVGKDISINESLSNSTQTNPLAENLNAAASEANAAKLNNYKVSSDNPIAGITDQFKNRIEHMMRTVAAGNVSTVVSGEGRVVLPELWQDSNFSRTVSMNFTFTSPYGHNLAIFENTYIPFLLLFCMTMPRQLSTKTFTNPFFVRVNMKGLFTIPMGIIESMTIERGEDKNNWTSEGIPRTIKCSVSVKDLTPVLMMSMTRGRFLAFFQSNDGFSSYINTIGGLSLKDQRNLGKRADRWWKLITERARSRGKKGLMGVISDTLNPFGYVEPIIRGGRSGIIGRNVVKLSQLGLNPFNSDEEQTNIY